ncbi:MAG: hypothetical protein HN742_35115 [Lentisphaerae bacterium]|nr:hypothetical protein [Lentisphaerota bacterium]MBT4819713.1 hypothetical protein [Lentisphaerota bacterium]MBT5609199.1 hypothetical protein [Lentisphaerota bacterium]MBT7055190.1 hypothetical protein [Lentisphaerota bacterium]MBT7847155.1 hypothetical protein [Lentisphaerota bacterium]
MLNRRHFLQSSLACTVGGAIIPSSRGEEPRTSQRPDKTLLPYDNTNPVLYDNDWTNDYVDWYLMALASAGDINYVGISTSSSIPPYNRHMTAEHLAKQVKRRREIVRIGRESGFRNIPDPVAGTKGHLRKPVSGKIADTVPLDSPGTRQIIEQAHKTAPGKPLVICVGGPLTVVADAFLLDNAIAGKVIVSYLDNHNAGMYGFNGWSDGWAAYIVLRKLQMVQFTVQSKSAARIPKRRLLELPSSPARDFMIKSTPDVAAPEGDADGPPAISLMRPDYVKQTKKISFGRWKKRHGHEMPMFKDDPNSRSVVATGVDRNVATKEWFRALKNPKAWHGNQAKSD